MANDSIPTPGEIPLHHQLAIAVGEINATIEWNGLREDDPERLRDLIQRARWLQKQVEALAEEAA